MTEPSQLQLGGLNQATVEWLRTPDSALAVKLTTHLISEFDWNLLQHPQGSRDAAFILHEGKQGVIVRRADHLTPDQVETDRARWTAIRSELPNKWKQLTLLYLTSEAPDEDVIQALEASSDRALLGKKTTSALLTTEGHLYGEAPKQLDGLVLSALEGDPLKLFQAVRQQGQDLDDFFTKLHSTQSWGTYTLIGLCVATFAWGTAAGGTEELWTLLRFGANFRPLTVEAGQWWRLLGSAFLHIGVVHLLVNMYSLKVVGEVLEKFMGNTRYLTLYGLSAVSGSLASVLTGQARVSAGASGAIFGLIGACVVLGYRHRHDIPRPMRQSMVNGMLPALGYNLLFGLSVPGIDNAAHMGGLVAGAALAWMLPPRVVTERLPQPIALGLAALTAVLLMSQFFTFSKAYSGLQLSALPSTQKSYGMWTVKIPNLFQPTEQEGIFSGPGVNILYWAIEWPESSPPTSDQLLTLLNTESKLKFSPDGETTAGGSDWHYFTSRDEVLRRFAITVQKNEIFLVGAVGPLTSERPVNQTLAYLLRSSKSVPTPDPTGRR